MKKEKQYRFSEIFYSIQGEGAYTGRNTAWIRFFSCNLECRGFGQTDPQDPSTYVLPYEDFDPSKITVLEDLPVWTKGCDSSYSWSAKYRHLAHLKTAAEICDQIEKSISSEHNPHGAFKHASTGQDTHMAFTGGEPLMSQHAMLAILNEFEARDNKPKYVTVETNGTQALKPAMFDKIQGIEDGITVNSDRFKEWFWSVSPKLSASGEDFDKTVLPDVVRGYKYASNHGQLKFVVDGTDECWDEVDRATNLYREAGVDWDVWIMPEGATVESQARHAGEIAQQAMARGYYVAARVHCGLFGNVIGT